MLFTTNSAKLSKTLKRLKGLLNAKQFVPIRDNSFLCKATDNGLEITASNGECSVTIKHQANVQEVGEMCVDANKLTKLLAILGNVDVTLSLEEGGQQLSITTNCGGYKMPIIPAGEYPKFASVTKGETVGEIVFDYGLFRALNRTMWATSKLLTQPVMQGVLIEQKAGSKTLNFCATDTHVLALFSMGGYSNVKPFKAVIPTRACNAVKSLFATSYPVVMRYASDSPEYVEFASEDIKMTVRTLRGTYPDYARAIPSPTAIFAQVGRKEMLRALNCASLLVDIHTVILKFTDNNVYVGAKDIDFDTAAHSNLPAKLLGASKFKAAFDSYNLANALNSLSDPEVVMQFTDNAHKPLLMTEVSNGMQYQVLVMRMSLDN